MLCKPAQDWFRVVVGTTEAEWLAAPTSPNHGLKLLVPDSVTDSLGPRVGVVCRTGHVVDAGSFSTWSVGQLEATAQAAVEASGKVVRRRDLPIVVLVRKNDSVDPGLVDTHALIAAAEPDTMFQVASNFNCLEGSSVLTDIRSGSFVTNLMVDRTQAPAASSACALSALVRTHGAFVHWDPHLQAHVFVGQRQLGPRGLRAQPQVELLGHPSLAPYFPVINGKVLAVEPCGEWSEDARPPVSKFGAGAGAGAGAGTGTGTGIETETEPGLRLEQGTGAEEIVKPVGAFKVSKLLPSSIMLSSRPETRALYKNVRVGLHCDAPAMFRRVLERGACEVHLEGIPVVDQVFVAAVNMNAEGAKALRGGIAQDRMNFLLDAAYRGTYGAAALRHSKHLVLTLVGGGVFGNPWSAIGEAIGRAHAEWVCCGNCPNLETITLPVFPAGVAAVKAMVDAIRLQGVRVVVQTLT